MAGPSWPVSGFLEGARRWLRTVSACVPPGRRLDWLDEWEGELWQLWRRAGRVPRRYGRPRAAVLVYLAGAPVSALWEWKEEWVTDLWQDIRYGARTLVRAPGFLAVAVLTLALGIGANTTVFSLMNGLLFREPPGIAAPDDLVRIGRGRADDERFDNWSYPMYRDFAERSEWFSGVAGFASAGSVILGRGLDAEAVPGQIASHNYFDVLGVRMALGRDFLPGEVASPGAAPVTVISDALWRRRFGGSAEAVGAGVAVNGRDFEVIGVAPPGFGGSDVYRAPADIWIPTSMIETAFGPGSAGMLDRRMSSWFWMFARRAGGVTLEQARAATEALHARILDENPELEGQGIRVIPGIGLRPDERAGTESLGRLLFGIVLLVLLIACANLAGLVLARGTGRRGEMAVRSALGASRTRVLRQLLTESLLLAAAGGAVAVGLTWLASSRLAALIPYSVSVEFEPDGRVFGFALATAVVAAVLFGLLPALRAARADVRHSLAGHARTATHRGTRLRRGLVALQLALSFVLLSGTAVLLRSLYNARVVNPGFAADRVAVVDLDAGLRSGYDEDAGRAFYRRLRDDVAALPGVDAVGLVAELPIVDFQSNHTPNEPGTDLDVPRDGPPPPPVLSNYADAGYFDALGVPLLAGRTFRPGDHGEGAVRVVVIDRTLAERFFPDQDPVGRTLPFGADPDWDDPATVIGVVGAVRNRSLRGEPAAQYWIPFDRNYRGDMTVVARTSGDPAGLAARIGEAVQRLDPGMPVLRSAPLRRLIGGTLQETRLVSALIAIFGVIALALATVGLYGVMAYGVSQRTRELGIRIAVGATARDVLGLILRQGLWVSGIGLVIGIGLAAGALRLLRGMLFDVSPADPIALALGALVLMTAAVGAALVPAWRATRIEPVSALREE
jgi:predicted permease